MNVLNSSPTKMTTFAKQFGESGMLPRWGNDSMQMWKID